MRTTVLLLLVSAAAPAAAQQAVNCPGSLSESQVALLLEGQAPEARLRQLVSACGVSFAATEEALARLRRAGATAAVLDALRAAPRPGGGGPAWPAIEFVAIPPGRFEMGSDDGGYSERPPHQVQITKGFEIGKYEVTQAQWEAVMGFNPSRFKGPDRPVEEVSWDDAQEFLRKLNERNDGHRYRLPTEAEWEYAAPAYPVELDEIAWYEKNSGGQTRPVGQKKPNGRGLYDMQGNVWEWCQDWHDEKYYGSSPVVDPQGPPSGHSRVLRGGSWFNDAWRLRVPNRHWMIPSNQDGSNGLRCVREVRVRTSANAEGR
jgi:formylglycine-generating enzyme required for sulfatase activity